MTTPKTYPWKVIDPLLWALTTAALAYTIYCVFLVVPNERVMGPIQRIFYFHVGSATACYVSFALVFFASVLYLATHEKKYDMLSHSAGEVGFVFCTVVLVSGMIWGHTAWNTWFRFEPRLVSFLILWLIFLAFTLLRTFGESGKIASHSAVIGILGAVTVPIMIYSIKLLPAAAQLHPQIVENQGLKDPSFTHTMFMGMAALTLLQFLLVRIRYRIEVITRDYLAKR